MKNGWVCLKMGYSIPSSAIIIIPEWSFRGIPRFSETPEWWLVGWVELVWGAKMFAKICLCLCFYIGCMDIFPRSSQLWKQTNNMISFDRLGAKFRGERVGIAQPLRSFRSRLLEINSILYNQVEISGKNLTWQLCVLYLFPIPPARHSPPLQRLSGTPWNLLWWPMQGLRQRSQFPPVKSMTLLL